MQQFARMRRAVAVSFASLSLVSALPAQDAAVKEIIRLEDQWGVASIKRDGATVARMLSDGFLSFTDKGVLNTKALLVKAIDGDTTTYVSGRNSGYKAQVHGNTVIIVGVWTVTKKGASGNVTTKHAWTDTWIRQADGRWLCAASQSTLVK